MKRIGAYLLGLAVVLFGPLPAFGQSAGIESKQLSSQLRLREGPLLRYVSNTATVSGTNGLDGVILSRTVNGLTGLTETSSLGAMPYPAIVRYAIVESGDDTLSPNIVIDGIGIDGQPLHFEASAIGETAANTNVVFAKVDRVRVSNLQALGDASDYIVVVASRLVGLPIPVRSSAGIYGVCAFDDAGVAAERCILPASCTTSAYTGSTQTTYIDLSSCTFSGLNTAGTLNDRDFVRIRLRGAGY